NASARSRCGPHTATIRAPAMRSAATWALAMKPYPNRPIPTSSIENLRRGLRPLSRRGMRIAVGAMLREQRRARLTRDPLCGTIRWHRWLRESAMFGGLHGAGPWVGRVPLRLTRPPCTQYRGCGGVISGTVLAHGADMGAGAL